MGNKSKVEYWIKAKQAMNSEQGGTKGAQWMKVQPWMKVEQWIKTEKSIKVEQ